MRVLGIDPGLTRCGLGVVEGTLGRPLSLVAVDVARTDRAADLGHRLLAVEEVIDTWITAHAPDALAVERVFSQANLTTVMGTAQASGIALVTAARRKVPVVMHTPSEVKAAVTGNGRADKRQVASMVTRLLRLSEPPTPADAADALALAICHVWRGSAAARLEAAVTAAPGIQAMPDDRLRMRPGRRRRRRLGGRRGRGHRNLGDVHTLDAGQPASRPACDAGDLPGRS
jgi:crossover junction endodeoxyribonuclease RuvC